MINLAALEHLVAALQKQAEVRRLTLSQWRWAAQQQASPTSYLPQRWICVRVRLSFFFAHCERSSASSEQRNPSWTPQGNTLFLALRDFNSCLMQNLAFDTRMWWVMRLGGMHRCPWACASLLSVQTREVWFNTAVWILFTTQILGWSCCHVGDCMSVPAECINCIDSVEGRIVVYPVTCSSVHHHCWKNFTQTLVWLRQ